MKRQKMFPKKDRTKIEMLMYVRITNTAMNIELKFQKCHYKDTF